MENENQAEKTTSLCLDRLTRSAKPTCPSSPKGETATNLRSQERNEEVHETNEPEGPESKTGLEALEAELAESRQEIQRLSSLIRERERADREAADFAEFFPGMNREEIPDFVREQAENEGIPLIAAYALYARKQELAAIRAGDAAKKSAGSSAGAVGGTSKEADLFTLEQIRSMTPREVKKHYKTIMKSLNKG